MTVRRFFTGCLIMPALLAASPSGGRCEDLRPADAVETIVRAFDDHQIIALSEMHCMREEHDFIQALLRDRSFQGRVDAVVMEGANALYQDILDGYILDGDVSLSEVRKVWRNSSQSPNTIWDAQVFENIYTTIHEINMGLPESGRIRVLAGDVPVDWDRIGSADDLGKYMMDRNMYYAKVVEEEVFGKNGKALLIMGGMHLLKAGGRPGNRRTVTGMLEILHPGSVFVVWPHAGLLGADMDRKYLPEDEVKEQGPGSMTTESLEARLASWPVPSIALVKDTWLGDLGLSLLVPGGFSFDGAYIPSKRDHGGLKLSDGIDAYLYVGPVDSLTLSGISPAVLEDEAYLEELNRRSLLKHGRPHDPGILSTKPGRYFQDCY